MQEKNRRRKYLIHPASQFKFIILSILPALLISTFCSFLFFYTGESILKGLTQNINNGIGAISLSVYRLETGKLEAPALEVETLKNELAALKTTLDTDHFKAMRTWHYIKMITLATTAVVVLIAALLALLHSHKIAGPAFRLRDCMERLARGEDIPPVRLRTGDQFTEVAEALETLRVNCCNALNKQTPREKSS